MIQIPYQFIPRTYQLELMTAMDSGFKRAIAVYHRRAGKDKTLFNMTIKKAFQRVGAYYYFFPEFAQGRRVIWDGRDGSGIRFLDHIPPGIGARFDKTNMKIDLPNGSLIQVLGTDKFDKVRGSNPVGCVFSEYAFQNPAAWNTVRPILAENGGWAVFNSTPNGKNHFWKLLDQVQHNPEWFTQVITVEDSLDENGVRYVPESTVQEEIDAGMSDDMVQQEFYCSFTANAEGFFYLSELDDAYEQGRIGNVPYTPNIPVNTWWDVGYGDDTAIWFTQIVDRAIHVIDFERGNSGGIDKYAKLLASKPYNYGEHNFPHDIVKGEFGTGTNAWEVAQKLFPNTRLNKLQKISLTDGINAARATIPRCYFDEKNCELGLEALMDYHREWDDKYQEYKQTPAKGWSNHAADAFRYLATGITMPRTRSLKKEKLRKLNKSTRNSWMAA